MTSDEKDSKVEHIAINSELIQHSEYEIEVVDNHDVTLVKDARKLVIVPTWSQNAIAFKRNKDTLLTIPISNIDNVIVISNVEDDLKKEKQNSTIQITFSDTVLKIRSLVFTPKNEKDVNIIQQQIKLLKDAEVAPSIQRAIKIVLNPALCNNCVENKYLFELNFGGKLCLSCFEEEYGKILLQTDDKESVEYFGGHKDHVIGGILGKHSQSGKMYLTEDHIIFAKDDKDISKKWELFIPLSSVILNWDVEERERQKNVQWEGTTFNNFGFGCGFMRRSKKSIAFVIPYIDGKDIPQEPVFRILDVQKWASELYMMTVKAKMNSSQLQNISEDNAVSQTTANCFICNRQFMVYDLVICYHCNTTFCDICIKKHSTKQEIEFDSKYIGGHKLYPKSSDVKVHMFSDRIEVEALHIRIPYTWITDIENADEKKISARRMFLVGLYSFAWKKKDLYTIIEYLDGFNQKQTLIFDFGKKIQEAQQKIYDRMLAFRFAKERLESQKMDQDLKLQKLSGEEKIVTNSGGFQPQISSNDESRPGSNTALQDNSVISNANKTDKHDDKNPLNILKVRLAKGEINKEEYEEMRKMIED